MNDRICLHCCVSCSRRHGGWDGGVVVVQNTQGWGLMELWGWMGCSFWVQPPHNTLLRMMMQWCWWPWSSFGRGSHNNLRSMLKCGWNKAFKSCFFSSKWSQNWNSTFDKFRRSSVARVYCVELWSTVRQGLIWWSNFGWSSHNQLIKQVKCAHWH